MVKPFAELYVLDISQRISKKPTFKKMGSKFEKSGELDYIGWSDCLVLLHENGAERVIFNNICAQDGHPVFLRENAVPFVRVYVEVDGDRREITYPVIDGSKDIKPEELKQSDVHNASQRAFAKCVAVNWGLGLKLWTKEEKTDMENRGEDLSVHSLMSVKRRIEQEITSKISRGMDLRDLLSCVEIAGKTTDEKTLNRALAALDWLNAFEKQMVTV